MEKYYYGIDFGTTNSAIFAISVVNNSISDMFTIGESDEIPLPSYVAINRFTGKVITGIDAKNSIVCF